MSSKIVLLLVLLVLLAILLVVVMVLVQLSFHSKCLDGILNLTISRPSLWQDDGVATGKLKGWLVLLFAPGRSQKHGPLENVKTIDVFTGWNHKGDRCGGWKAGDTAQAHSQQFIVIVVVIDLVKGGFGFVGILESKLFFAVVVFVRVSEGPFYQFVVVNHLCANHADRWIVIVYIVVVVVFGLLCQNSFVVIQSEPNLWCDVMCFGKSKKNYAIPFWLWVRVLGKNNKKTEQQYMQSTRISIFP